VGVGLRKPSFVLLAAVWGGLVCGGAARGWLAPVLGIVIAATVGLGFVSGGRTRLLLLAAAFAALGVLRSPEAGWNRAAVPQVLAGTSGAPVVLEVKTPFLAAECSETAVALVEEVVAGPTSLEGRRVVLRGLDELPPPGGQRFRVRGEFTAPRARLNPFGPDQVKRCARLGVVGAVDVTSIRAPIPTWPAGPISRFRERLENLIRTSYPGEAAGMLEAMLLGQRGHLDPRVETVMLRAGTYHVISVSGLHVGIVLYIISAFLSILALPRCVLSAISAACTVFYVIFTGTPPSAARSGGLFLCAGVVKALEWKVDLANCVCATGTVLLLVLPHFAWDIGFQLSLGAVLGMAMLAGRSDPGWPSGAGRVSRLGRLLTAGLVVCLAAEAFTLPVVLNDFGRASLVAPLGNLIMIPLTTLAIAGGMEGAVALVFSERLAALFIKGAAALTHLSIAGAEFVARLPCALIYVGRPGPARVVPYVAGLAYLSFAGSPNARRANLLLLAAFHVLMVIPAPRTSQDLLRVTFLYVGDGDATLLRMPGGQTVLVDAGPDPGSQGRSQSQVVSLLAIEGINRIDQVVVTHAHDDHYGGLTSLVENVAVGEILVGRLEGEPEYLRALEVARAKGIEVRTVGAGDRWQCGRAQVTVLHPRDAVGTGPAADPNPASVVLRVEMGDFALLLTGDLTPDMGQALARDRTPADTLGPVLPARNDLAATVLKAPHHGAPNSVDRGFLEACGACIAVVSAGSKWASHPWPATLDLLEASGARTIVTSTDGAVSLATDGRVVEVVTESGKRLTLATCRVPD
jgi:competence protein ComEC